MDDLQFDDGVPHAARIWNYWMGGTDNYEADRAAGKAVADVYPDIVTMALESRRFLIRVVRFLTAEAGIRQFLDIGTGLPTMSNTHEVAQEIAPESRVVYVDNDPLVIEQSRALLGTPPGPVTYLEADYHDPEAIVAASSLDLTQPVAVMFMGVLGYVGDFATLRSIVSRTLAPMPSGSHLVLWDGTNTSASVNEGGAALIEAGAVPYHLRSPDQLGRCFEGLDLIPPGLTQITQWRGEPSPPSIDAHGAVARKP
ncbi:SAM-dependent methyltransferase [Acrocarpospora catenulata]|uniref:SAM-dependent methyltransferase n=1 Tax=Acrocarpospora catenulata TaxID=2836182 RepID=UPI001BDACF6A|nr:SAM-dependent methyltransferase [Acrocarpospora catenulata]